MKHLKRTFGIFLSVCLAYFVVGSREGNCQAISRNGDTIARHIGYGFTLRNTTGHVVEKAELWAYAPVEHTMTQQSVRIKTSHSVEILQDALGNRILLFTFTDLPPYATKIVTISTDLFLSPLGSPASLLAKVPTGSRRSQEETPPSPHKRGLFRVSPGGGMVRMQGVIYCRKNIVNRTIRTSWIWRRY